MPLFLPRTHRCSVLDTEALVARSIADATELDSVVRECYLKQDLLDVATTDSYTVDRYAKQRPCWRFDRRLYELGSAAQPELIRSGVSQ